MGSRKPSKPSSTPGIQTNQSSETKFQPGDPPIAPNASEIAIKPNQDTDHGGASAASLSQSVKSWYGGGTWRRGSKATPVTQVARESILAATDKASDLLSNTKASTTQTRATPVRSSSSSLSRSLRRANKSQVVTSFTPAVNVSSDPNSSGPHALPEHTTAADVTPSLSQTKRHDPKENPSLNPSLESEPTNGQTAKQLASEGSEAKANPDALPWRSWFFRNGPMSKPEPPEPPELVTQSTTNEHETLSRRRNSDPGAAPSKGIDIEAPRSWFSLWPVRSPNLGSSDETISAAETGPDKPLSPNLRATAKTTLAPTAASTQLTSTAKAPGWAFWSREPSHISTLGGEPSNKGESVLAEAGSQNPPKIATSNSTQGVSDKEVLSVSMIHKPGNATPSQTTNRPETSSNVVETTGRNKIVDSALTQIKLKPKNLLLPPIANTYLQVPRISLLQSLNPSRWWHDVRSNEENCVRLIHNPPRIKKALAIGVHGYFPAPLIRSVLGQPTGTSVRFADGAAKAISSWTASHGYECEVDKIALEGEGRILERVDMLWKLLLNWIDNIRRADFIMVACHSQGVPVAIMLIAKLIDFGCVQNARIGVCAMAGVNLGPFIDFRSRWIGGSAGELFDFAKSNSQVSRDYFAALSTAVKSCVRIAYIGSIDDQLVSLEVSRHLTNDEQSSTFGAVEHPHIYRAVFVNGSVHAPDFLTHLVGFALKLRNLGISDHGLIRELSLPLAGSLYSGEGHSTIYEEAAVYDLAVQNALETSTIEERDIKKTREWISAAQNPYILPFSLRGVLEEDYVKKELHEETMELLRQFDEWKPSSKVLKDVKFRLEGVRSKL
ncbi:MAG: hypothetical protein Q9219_003628 [cf. Caloplaca sp. 3 TL-2023]